jgi:hypothetical protein
MRLGSLLQVVPDPELGIAGHEKRGYPPLADTLSR